MLKWLSNNNGRTYEVWEMAANGEEAIRLVAEFERADEADHYVVTVNDRVEWIKHYKDDVETRVAAVKGRAEEVCRLWDRTAQRALQWARRWKALAREYRWADQATIEALGNSNTKFADEAAWAWKCEAAASKERDAARAEAERQKAHNALQTDSLRQLNERLKQVQRAAIDQERDLAAAQARVRELEGALAAMRYSIEWALPYVRDCLRGGSMSDLCSGIDELEAALSRAPANSRNSAPNATKLEVAPGRWEPCACNDPDCELCQSRWTGGEG